MVLAGPPSGSSLCGSCSFSENQPWCPLTGFVKSQEGENEEGSEGELVVKFGETLPKVVQAQGEWPSLARPGQGAWASHGAKRTGAHPSFKVFFVF